VERAWLCLGTKSKDGRYQAAAYVYRPDGTRHRQFVYGKTRDEVADKLTDGTCSASGES
jgi:hypothetical protein